MGTGHDVQQSASFCACPLQHKAKKLAPDGRRPGHCPEPLPGPRFAPRRHCRPTPGRISSAKPATLHAKFWNIPRAALPCCVGRSSLRRGHSQQAGRAADFFLQMPPLPLEFATLLTAQRLCDVPDTEPHGAQGTTMRGGQCRCLSNAGLFRVQSVLRSLRDCLSLAAAFCLGRHGTWCWRFEARRWSWSVRTLTSGKESQATTGTWPLCLQTSAARPSRWWAPRHRAGAYRPTHFR